MPPADGKLPTVTLCQPELEGERTELTLAPEEEFQHDSDQGCEPATSVDKGSVTKENGDWMINLHMDLSTPTLSHPLPSSSLFLNSPNDFINYELFISSIYMDCDILNVLLSCYIAPPSLVSPPAPPLLDVSNPVPSLGKPCYAILQIRLQLQILLFHLGPSICRLRLGSSHFRLHQSPLNLWPRTYGPELWPFTPMATAGSSFSPGSPLSSLTSASPQPSGTLATPTTLVAAVSSRTF